MKDTCVLFLSLCRQQRSNAEHLQRAEGDHKPQRHGPGRHTQLLPHLPAVHTAVHPGSGPAQPERHRGVCRRHRQEERQDHAHYFRRRILGMAETGRDRSRGNVEVGTPVDGSHLHLRRRM